MCQGVLGRSSGFLLLRRHAPRLCGLRGDKIAIQICVCDPLEAGIVPGETELQHQTSSRSAPCMRPRPWYVLDSFSGQVMPSSGSCDALLDPGPSLLPPSCLGAGEDAKLRIDDTFMARSAASLFSDVSAPAPLVRLTSSTRWLTPDGVLGGIHPLFWHQIPLTGRIRVIGGHPLPILEYI